MFIFHVCVQITCEVLTSQASYKKYHHKLFLLKWFLSVSFRYRKFILTLPLQLWLCHWDCIQPNSIPKHSHILRKQTVIIKRKASFCIFTQNYWENSEHTWRFLSKKTTPIISSGPKAMKYLPKWTDRIISSATSTRNTIPTSNDWTLMIEAIRVKCHQNHWDRQGS